MDVRAISHSIISPLGIGTETHAQQLLQGKLAISYHDDKKYSSEPFYGAIIEDVLLDDAFSSYGNPKEYSKLEKMALVSVKDALKSSPDIDPTSERTIIVFSTTKGNIDLFTQSRNVPRSAYLWDSAEKIRTYLGNPNPVYTVSNACISGTLALIIGSRLIKSGRYDSAIVIGADLFSHFVLSGFKSFQALSPLPCKPFDANRTGINLGEAGACIVLTRSDLTSAGKVNVLGGASSNDANHISGPSRTGDGLYYAIQAALENSNIKDSLEIDYISSHGTATLYNDEMEAKAFAWAGLNQVPTNSLKGYFGHTLGTSGILESVLAIDALVNQRLFASAGYENLGVSENLNILTENKFQEVNTCLKTSSGFGSCNAALVLSTKSI